MGYRKDVNITRQIPGYRRILAFLTPHKNAAMVLFQDTIDVTETLDWIHRFTQRTGKRITVLHVFLAAAGRALHENPNLNRYVTGHRFYQRDGVYVSVSAKKALKQGARIVLLKMPLLPGDDVEAVADRFATLLGEGRSGKELRQEREVDLFLRLPAPLLKLMIALVRWLDRLHLLPGWFIDPDPLYTSLVVANLGSIGLPAVYHHLYEYGNCPFFVCLGQIREEQRLIHGELRRRKVMEMRVSFDERVEDGLACALALAQLKEMIQNPDLITGELPDFGDAPPTRPARDS